MPSFALDDWATLQAQNSAAANAWHMVSTNHHTLPRASQSYYKHALNEAQPALLVEASVTSRSTSDRLSFSSAPYEDQSDDIIESEEIVTSISDMSYSRLVDSANSHACRLKSEFSQDQATLSPSKVNYPASLDSHSASALPALLFNKRSEWQEKSPGKPRSHHPTSSLVVQTGQSRRFTTEENANFHCQMQGCNKSFHNIHNFEVHMRSHVEVYEEDRFKETLQMRPREATESLLLLLRPGLRTKRHHEKTHGNGLLKKSPS
ncbi:hypothetical protein OIDMADRAFT_56289 [Oidiodendron maius Zn]|uniref:C2H2-type domain-containing protein n=1 Tax=Oidiodendron maius (strain Zn) TaxID=913774 RepID=A0A0C3H9W9_OIDMZ|nr:hypothetical protein OIDMADRAFT_56289 [Oidiodendron maius Zn]